MAEVCEQRALVIHVHGPQAQIDAFFEALDASIEEAQALAGMYWPSLAFLEPELEDDEP